MSSTRLIVFCTPEEMEGWLEQLKEARDTAMLLFTKSEDKGSVVGPGQRMPPLGDAMRIFVVPGSDAPATPMKFEDVRAREWGWVDIQPPARVSVGGQRALLMAQVHGSSGTTFASSQLRWLKRRLADSLHSPVDAFNVVTGGTHTYRDIRFTDGAAAAFREGVEWRQFATGNVVFRPQADRGKAVE